MAEYPQPFIEKLDAQCGKDAWPLIGMFALDIAVAAGVLHIVGELANSLL
jgi:hypothetical protein